MNGRRLLFASILALLAQDAWAESPNLARVMPRGSQRGTEVDVVFSGSQLKDAQEVFLYKPGIEVLKLEATDNSTVKVRLKIAADAPLGEHPLRLRTATGISDLRTFYVGRFAAIDEKEPNTKFQQPQKIGLNITVTGAIGNEDVDHFSVELKKGQRLTAELEGMRLGTSLFDAYLAIFDTKRFEIAASDDNALLLQDPLLSIVAPEDGTYVIMVRESSYGGGDNGQYRLHVGTYPRPLAVYPPGGKAGEELDVTYLGDVKGPLKRKIKLPTTGIERLGVYVEEDGQFPPSPNYVRISDYPNALEREPNNTKEQATATDLPLPVALNGIIQSDGDEDWFRFKAKKGEAFDVKVCARAVRSPLDPVLFIYQPNGSQMATNDDQGGPDSVARFTAAADGEYYIRVRDHLKKGGPTYVYRVEFNTTKPNVYTHIPAYDREPRDQVRQWVVVPKGNRFAAWIRVNRTGFNGEMKLKIDGLPEGITWTAEPIATDVDRVVVVFEAKADAKVAGKLVDVVAKPVDPGQKIEGGFRQDVNLVYGPPNNTVYYGTRVERLAVAVSEAAPFKLRIVEPKVPLVQNGAMNLRVVAERNPGFDAPIELRLLWTPPGLGTQGTVTLPKGQNEVVYPINANGNAPAKTWKIAVLGSAPAANGLAWVSTQLMPLSVASPYIGMKIDMTAVEQGKETRLVCKLEQLKPFEGKAKVSIQGLPAQVTAEPAEKEITKDDKEVVFKVKTDPKSPAGQHKGLFGRIVITDKGEAIFHSVAGGSVLRIDTPPVKKDAKPGDAKKAEAPAKPKG